MDLPIQATGTLDYLQAGSVALPIHSTSETTLVDEVVEEFVARARDAGEDESFYVANLDEIVKLHDLWQSVMPRVHPFYAVKVNEDPGLLKVLSHLGTGFDCASKDEIQRVLAVGVDPGRIVYAHPCKQPSNLIYAAENGVSLTVIDNEHEIYKIEKLCPSMRMMVRIQADDPSADWKLGNKYGCDVEEGKRLIKLCDKLDLPVVGVSFHVGSGCHSSKAFHEALTKAKVLFDYAWNVCGIKMELLDIGGGFMGSSESLVNFPKFCASINGYLDDLFPAISGVRIIAEPGRFFAMMPFTLCTSVIAKRVTPDPEHRPMYYISDGKYGSLTWYPLEGKGSFRVVSLDANHSEISPLPAKSASIWGPTCCGTDCVISDIILPHLEIGDWIIFDDMGAYTLANASLFNGFQKPRVVYTAHASLLNRINGTLPK